MKHISKSVLILIFLFSVVISYAQKGNYDQESEATFQPMLSLGMGFHSFQGDIMGNKINPLSGNVGFRAGMRINMKENIDLSFLFSNVILSEQESNDQKFKSTINSVGTDVHNCVVGSPIKLFHVEK